MTSCRPVLAETPVRLEANQSQSLDIGECLTRAVFMEPHSIDGQRSQRSAQTCVASQTTATAWPAAAGAALPAGCRGRSAAA